MKTVRIILNTEIAHLVYLLEFEKPFNFIPGQVINIGKEGVAPRMYCIASGMEDSYCKVLFDVKLSGMLTPYLKDLKPGDFLQISEPFGSFFCDSGPAYWIAAGTGIAPFYAMFRSGLATNKILIHGGRYANSFYFQNEFEPYFPGNNYVRCASAKTDVNFFHGRVTHFLDVQTTLPNNLKYYLCGNAEMIVETRDILIEKKIPFENIIAEIYF
jgi:ferredoxin/flavodoxin---NADP+ reductase